MPQSPKSETNTAAQASTGGALLPPGPAWRAAEAAGFDMSLVEENLRMTPWERFVQHERALRMVAMLREAWEKKNGRG